MLRVTAPVQLALIAAMLLLCGRPVFFRRTRVTRDGRRMSIVKSRIVPVEDSGAHWAVSFEQCTALGRWLRAAHLGDSRTGQVR